jgi:hypothetical protein
LKEKTEGWKKGLKVGRKDRRLEERTEGWKKGQKEGYKELLLLYLKVSEAY